jgi:hypothetical protein
MCCLASIGSAVDFTSMTPKMRERYLFYLQRWFFAQRVNVTPGEKKE